jgi:hypothetical protein
MYLRKKTSIFLGVVALIIALITPPSTANAALLGWDLVDDGKHLDWDSNTKYGTSVTNAVNLWEGHISGVIRPDSAWVTEDVFVSDFYEVSTTLGETCSCGTIKLNDYHYADMTADERTKTTTHEFGHALGLDHTSGSTDIMKQGKLSTTSLSQTDKDSYDEAYLTY